MTKTPCFHVFLVHTSLEGPFYRLSRIPTPRHSSSRPARLLQACFSVPEGIRPAPAGSIAMRTAAKSLSGGPPALVSIPLRRTPHGTCLIENTAKHRFSATPVASLRNPDASTRLWRPWLPAPRPVASSRRGPAPRPNLPPADPPPWSSPAAGRRPAPPRGFRLCHRQTFYRDPESGCVSRSKVRSGRSTRP